MPEEDVSGLFDWLSGNQGGNSADTTQLKGKIDSLSKKVNSLDTSVTTLNKNFNTSVKNIDTIHNSVLNLKNEIDTLKGTDASLSEKVAKIDKVAKEADSLQQQIKSLKESMPSEIHMPKMVRLQKSVPVSGGTVSIPLPSGIKNPTVIALGEEEQTINVSLPKVNAKTISTINSVHLGRVSVTTSEAGYRIGKVNIGNKMSAKASTSTPGEIPKLHLPALQSKTIKSKLKLDGSTGLIAVTRNMLNKGMSLPNIPVPSMKPLDKFPEVKGLSMPRMWYVVFVPRYHWVNHCNGHMKGNKPEINKDCPYNGWVIPFYETPGMKKMGYTQKKNHIQTVITKLLPTKSEWGRWLAYGHMNDALGEVGNSYNHAAYENLLHAMGTWKAGSITLDCVLKPPLGKLMSAIVTPIVKGAITIDSKIDGLFHSTVNGMNKVIVGTPTSKYSGIKVKTLSSPYWRAKGRTYISALEYAVNQYNRSKTTKNAKMVHDYLIEAMKHPPTLRDSIVPYSGGINAALDAVRMNINSIISMSNVISRAIPIATIGNIKGSVDALTKPAYAYLQTLGKNISGMVDSLVGQYNSHIATFNRDSDKMRSKVIKAAKEAIVVLNTLINNYNKAITTTENEINKTIAHMNISLSYMAGKITETADKTNSAIKSAEDQLNSSVIPSVNDTIRTVNQAISAINSAKSQHLTIKTTRPLTPVISGDHFTVTMNKGTLHYTILGLQ